MHFCVNNEHVSTKINKENVNMHILLQHLLQQALKYREYREAVVLSSPKKEEICRRKRHN